MMPENRAGRFRHPPSLADAELSTGFGGEIGFDFVADFFGEWGSTTADGPDRGEIEFCDYGVFGNCGEDGGNGADAGDTVFLDRGEEGEEVEFGEDVEWHVESGGEHYVVCLAVLWNLVNIRSA